MRALQGALGIENAVVAEDRDRQAVDAREARDERRAVEALELVELGAVDEPRYDLADVVLLLEVGRDDRLEVLDRIPRLRGLGEIDVDVLARVERADDAAHDRERMPIVGRVMVGDAGEAGV